MFEECTKHLLNDKNPSDFFIQEFECEEEICYPFTLLLELKTTEQSKQYHKEGNVWNHTMLVVDEAAKVRAKSRNPLVFMWAALLHDIGKPSTTRNRKGKITAYNHDEVGAVLSEKFLSELTDDAEFIQEVTALVKYHMQILYVVKDLSYSNIEEMKDNVDFNEIALLGWCDRMGRFEANYAEEEKNIQLFIKKCKASKR
jgi:putative nucleotidyltransferase with HDIG domain